MSTVPATSRRTNVSGNLLSALSYIVFLFLDLVDAILCVIYRLLDRFFEGRNTTPCYCIKGEEKGLVSETLYERKNVFRELGFLGLRKKWDGGGEKTRGGKVGARWSDCECESCVSWLDNGNDLRLHVVREPSKAIGENCRGKPAENVIFIHGFLSSSSYWTETVFPNLSEAVKSNYRLFALDLLGFGRSPKPRDCLYTLKDHLEMVEKSVIHPFQLDSFHLVGHSMGCIIALALAAKYSNSVKSITLIAPPYFPSSKEAASSYALRRLAERKLWPPMSFFSALMSWYEHLGRCVCFLLCRNHRIWEWILKLFSRKRDLDFMIVDMTRHTHHSAWHSMHNVLCGGAKFLDEFLEIMSKSRTIINIVHGDRDEVVPVECSLSIKLKVPGAEVNIIRNADHNNVIRGREMDLTRNLMHTWASATDITSKEDRF